MEELIRERESYRWVFRSTLSILDDELSKSGKKPDENILKKNIVQLENLMRQIHALDRRIFDCLRKISKTGDEAQNSELEEARIYTNHYINMKRRVDEIINKPSGPLEKLGWFALKTAALSGAALGGVAVIVPALGFTAGGVAAGSAAAAYQSAALGGTIASGSTFAVLQSVGAAGLAGATKVAVVAGSAVVSAVHSAFTKK